MLASDLIYYDFVENGVLGGGAIEASQSSPLHSQLQGPLPPPPPFVSTKIIDNGPSSNRIDLVILGDGYTVNDLALYKQQVDDTIAAFFNESPLKEYASLFNVHRVDVISNESGVDNDPNQGVLRDTALDAEYWCSGTERLLCINVGKTLAAAANAPEVDQILVLANSSKYGGAGYPSANIGTLAGGDPRAVEIALHEFGHSFADLADEYDYGGPDAYAGPEPNIANVSIFAASAMNSMKTKWHMWLNEPNVDTFQGANYSRTGIYRPTDNSKMRALDRPFEQVNTEQFVLSGYKTVRPIDYATPSGTYGDSTTFFVTPIRPTSHLLDIQWFVDGVPIAGATQATLNAATLGLTTGMYSLSVEVVDKTSLVRDVALRSTLMTDRRSWILDVKPDIQLADAYLVDQNGIRLADPLAGEKLYLKVDFFTRNLDLNASYRVDLDINGRTVSVLGQTAGAGSLSGTWSLTRQGWFALAGVNNARVRLDVDSSVDEGDETNNSLSFSFNAALPASLSNRLILPFVGALFSELNISNYVDVDPTTAVADYNGRSASYDGHEGWDIVTGNFQRMDAGARVIAAAQGKVVAVFNGSFDRQTSILSPAPPANYVVIDHGSGWQTSYLHLRRDSIQVQVNDQVLAGDFLGYMGSSGASTDAHLHFALTHEGRPVEPGLAPTAYFVNPPSYVGQNRSVYLSGITNYDPTAHIQEEPSRVAVYDRSAGQSANAWARFSGLQSGDVLQFVWLKPNDTQYAVRTRTLTQDYSDSWWWFDQTLPQVPDAGNWTVEYRVNGIKLAQQSFAVTNAGAPEIRVEDSTGAIVIDNRYTPLDFGSVAQGATRPTKVLRVINHGSSSLSLSDLQVPAGFTILEGLSATLLPGEVDTISLGLETQTPGNFAGEVRFTTNDADENQFNFSVEGAVQSPTLSTLVVGIAERSTKEGNRIVANVRRLGNLTAPLVVNLSSSDTLEAVVPASVVIPAGARQANFVIDTIDDGVLDADEIVTISASASSYAGARNTLVVLDDSPPQPPLRLRMDVSAISEMGGRATATIARGNALFDQPVEVLIGGSPSTETTFPASVIIPANQSSVSFVVTALDDDLLDGDQFVTYVAQAEGFTSDSTTLLVIDYEQLELEITTAMSERNGSILATLKRGNIDDLQQALTVNLLSSDLTEATVPAQVVIPANAPSITFEIRSVDDRLLDGTQNVQIRAEATGYLSASHSIQVLDYEQLNVQIDTVRISEGGGSTSVRVSRSDLDDLSRAITVSLSGHAPSEMIFPTSLQIPAFASSAVFTIQAIDDLRLDGDQQFQIQASHIDYTAGSATLIIVDDEYLSVTIDRTSVAENGGVTTATVTRSNLDDLSQPLTVSLSTSDSGEASVPATIEIAAGAASAVFNVTGVDDHILDGTQNVRILAAHDAYFAGFATLSITDFEELTISVQAGPLVENGKYAAVNVTRGDTGDLSKAIEISLLSSDESEVTVPPRVVLPAGVATSTIDINLIDDALLDGAQTVQISVSHVQYVSGTVEFIVNDYEFLSLRFQANQTPENIDNMATLSRSNTDDLASPLTVFLHNNNESQATVPTSVIIPANQASVSFVVPVIDDDLIDGNQTVTVTASATDYESSQASFKVTDNDVPQLKLSIDNSAISENGGVANATIRRNTPTDADLVVQLSSNDSHVLLPSSVTIPAGETSFIFLIQAVDDLIADHDHLVRIAAQAAGHQAAFVEIVISDNDIATLVFEISTNSLSENGGEAIATLRRNSGTLSPLTVLISNPKPNRLQIPQSVFIPVGSVSASFTVSSIDNAIPDDDLVTTLLVSATGHVGASTDVSIVNNDAWTWTNPRNPYDVNDDSFVSPLDALLVINQLNSTQNSALGVLTAKPPFFFDVSTDNALSPIDALMVINRLNNPNGNGQAEGEAAWFSGLPGDTTGRCKQRNFCALDQFFGNFT